MEDFNTVAMGTLWILFFTKLRCSFWCWTYWDHPGPPNCSHGWAREKNTLCQRKHHKEMTPAVASRTPKMWLQNLRTVPCWRVRHRWTGLQFEDRRYEICGDLLKLLNSFSFRIKTHQLLILPGNGPGGKCWQGWSGNPYFPVEMAKHLWHSPLNQLA